ncbi:ThiF family adenylyltransferase [Paraburkholderia sp. 31.1]|uniref:ThiF family adenylyltransferase n=1 Tax=Paraburkholderia sp. 31.1 TaxID=2615205 RepID=UPI001656143C|nr:ThiF family adenylyltransferase [Paraburkholderia sp. 31.1]
MSEFSRDILFSRMIGLVTQAQMDALAGKRVAVPGCGGTGYTYAECLVRMGVGGINVADADTFGPENMNRQFGCTVDTIGRKKSDVLNERLASINPEVSICTFDYLDEHNIDAYLTDVDLVCDTLDFFIIRPRRLLYAKARERGIPVLICSPVAFGVTGHLFDPHGMSFDDYFGLNDEQDEQAQLERFGNGITPAMLYRAYAESPSLDFGAKKVASLSASCLMATSWGSSLALMMLLGIEHEFKAVPYCYQFDIRAARFCEVASPADTARNATAHARVVDCC